MYDIETKKRVTETLVAVLLVLVSAIATAEDAQSPSSTLLANVHVFDGVNEHRIENANALVGDNLIKQVSTAAIEADGSTVIDGSRRKLMLDIIGWHAHLVISYISVAEIKNELPGYLTIRSTLAARQLLDQGITPSRHGWRDLHSDARHR